MDEEVMDVFEYLHKNKKERFAEGFSIARSGREDEDIRERRDILKDLEMIEEYEDKNESDTPS